MIIQSHGTTTLFNRVQPDAEAWQPHIRNILRTRSRETRSHDLYTDYRLYEAIRNGRPEQERLPTMWSARRDQGVSGGELTLPSARP